MNTPRHLINKTNGKWFTVSFIKKNGDLRHMTCRTGVHKYVTGTGMAYNPKEHDLQVVWERAADKDGKEAYRMIHVPSILSFKCGEEVWP